MTRRIILLVVALFMMSCATVYERQIQFNEEEYASYEGSGTGRLCGQAI